MSTWILQRCCAWWCSCRIWLSPARIGLDRLVMIWRSCCVTLPVTPAVGATGSPGFLRTAHENCKMLHSHCHKKVMQSYDKRVTESISQHSNSLAEKWMHEKFIFKIFRLGFMFSQQYSPLPLHYIKITLYKDKDYIQIKRGVGSQGPLAKKIHQPVDYYDSQPLPIWNWLWLKPATASQIFFFKWAGALPSVLPFIIASYASTTDIFVASTQFFPILILEIKDIISSIYIMQQTEHVPYNVMLDWTYLKWSIFYVQKKLAHDCV